MLRYALPQTRFQPPKLPSFWALRLKSIEGQPSLAAVRTLLVRPPEAPDLKCMLAWDVQFVGWIFSLSVSSVVSVTFWVLFQLLPLSMWALLPPIRWSWMGSARASAQYTCWTRALKVAPRICLPL